MTDEPNGLYCKCGAELTGRQRLTCSEECLNIRRRDTTRENQRKKRADPAKWAEEYAARQTPEKKAEAQEYQARYYKMVTKPKRRRAKPPHRISKQIRLTKRKERKTDE